MTLTALPTATTYDEPAGVAPRGTVVVLTGRGESPAAYVRLGRRLATDAYRVRVVATDLDDLPGTRSAVLDVLADDASVRPHVLLGSDAGATYAAHLAAELDGQVGGEVVGQVDALVLAGLVVPSADATPAGPAGPAGAPAEEALAAELESRSACPAYRRVLGDDASFRPGALDAPLPTDLAAAPPRADLPTLVVHGAADAVTPVDVALAPYVGAPRTRALVVGDGRHDVLNDVTHRSVAANVVLFLESLRLGADLPAIVTPYPAP